MKKLFFLLLCSLFIIFVGGCGDDADEGGQDESAGKNIQSNNDASLPIPIIDEDDKDKKDPAEDKKPEEKETHMIWRFLHNCHSQPNVFFKDTINGQIWGPYQEKEVKIKCQIGHEICYGAWLGMGPYSDCSHADETGSCTGVDWNDTYYEWGCGKNCRNYSPYDRSQISCANCLKGANFQKVLRCRTDIDNFH